MSWRWIDKQILMLLHDESLAEHGGASGLRVEGLLDLVLARPLHLATHGDRQLAHLAAASAVGLAKNHAFVDGNKRAAFLSISLFLALNGYRLEAQPAEATAMMLGVAASEIDEPTLAAWIRENSHPRA